MESIRRLRLDKPGKRNVNGEKCGRVPLDVPLVAHELVAQLIPLPYHLLDKPPYFRGRERTFVIPEAPRLTGQGASLQGFEVDFLSPEIRPLEILRDLAVQGNHQIPTATAVTSDLRVEIAEDLVPFVIPVREEGNQVVVGAHGESFEIAGVLCDRQEFSAPRHVFRLVLESTGTGDGVEMEGVLQDESAVFEDMLVGIDDKSHPVFLRGEEERFQIAKIVDGGNGHVVDRSKDALPRLRGFANIEMR